MAGIVLGISAAGVARGVGIVDGVCPLEWDGDGTTGVARGDGIAGETPGDGIMDGVAAGAVR